MVQFPFSDWDLKRSTQFFLFLFFNHIQSDIYLKYSFLFVIKVWSQVIITLNPTSTLPLSYLYLVHLQIKKASTCLQHNVKILVLIWFEAKIIFTYLAWSSLFINHLSPKIEPGSSTRTLLSGKMEGHLKQIDSFFFQKLV